jgi:TfoX/Sxy family transcriptional regulator of competence genes
MAYDEGMAQLLRDDLAETGGISEKRMFGGLCFMLNGNMLCGVGTSAPMFRVGKELEAEALSLDGVAPLSFTKRKMGGMVEMDEDFFVEDGSRQACLALALAFVSALPAK